jgi:hypothetical protein
MNKSTQAETYNLNLSDNGLQTIGTVKFDEMDNAVVSITLFGKKLSEIEINPQELKILKAYFDSVNA